MGKIQVTEDARNPTAEYTALLRQEPIDPAWRAWRDFAFQVLPHGGNVAEFGAGFGNIAIPLSEAGLNYTAFDLNGAAIEHLNANAGQCLRAVQQDVEGLTEDAGVFDLIIIRSCLLNVMSPRSRQNTARSAKNVLSVGGVVIVEVLDPHWLQFGSGFENEYQRVSKHFRANHYEIRVEHLANGQLFENVESVTCLSEGDIAALFGAHGMLLECAERMSPLTLTHFLRDDGAGGGR